MEDKWHNSGSNCVPMARRPSIVPELHVSLHIVYVYVCVVDFKAVKQRRFSPVGVFEHRSISGVTFVLSAVNTLMFLLSR